MTKEEAKEYIRDCLDYDEAEKIIEALEQEPCEDAVSRADLIDKLEIIDKSYGSDFYWEVRKIVDSLPPVKPVACIATVKFNKEDMRRIVDEEVNKLTIELDTILDKIEDEVAQTDFDFGDYYDNTELIIEMVCNIIDKYKIGIGGNE